MLNLENITVVSVNSRDPENSIKAIERSCKYIKFKKAILLTDKKINHKYIQSVQIEPLTSIPHYNRFMVNELNRFIDTEFCLVVQPDGYVINPTMWLDEFLNYDYIGAPWDLSHSHNAISHCPEDLSHLKKVPIVVGNGGFSLRSKKFLETQKKICNESDYKQFPEDLFLSVVYRKKFIENNCKFAPIEIGYKFSTEAGGYDKNQSFGFHSFLLNPQFKE